MGVAVTQLDGDGGVGQVDGRDLSGKDPSAPDPLLCDTTVPLASASRCTVTGSSLGRGGTAGRSSRSFSTRGSVRGFGCPREQLAGIEVQQQQQGWFDPDHSHRVTKRIRGPTRHVSAPHNDGATTSNVDFGALRNARICPQLRTNRPSGVRSLPASQRQRDGSAITSQSEIGAAEAIWTDATPSPRGPAYASVPFWAKTIGPHCRLNRDRVASSG